MRFEIERKQVPSERRTVILFSFKIFGEVQNPSLYRLVLLRLDELGPSLRLEAEGPLEETLSKTYNLASVDEWDSLLFSAHRIAI